MNSNDQFESIVNAHYEALYRFALSLTRMESDAQDLTQQTFYVWATKGHQLRDASKVKTWLFTTLHRLFLGSRRRQNRFQREADGDDAEPLPDNSAESTNTTDASDVLHSLAKVDEIYQAALSLFYLEDSSYKEIAAILKIPLGTVKSRVARGIAQLRQIMKLDEFRDSSCKPQNHSPGGSPESSTSPQENASTYLRRHAPSMAEWMDFGYAGWDTSATPRTEQRSPAGFLVGANN